MRQSIQEQQETNSPKVVVTVMYHGRIYVLGCNGSFFAPEGASKSVSEPPALFPHLVSDASSHPGVLTVVLQLHSSRDRTRSRSLPHTEKFSAEGLIASSALAVLAVTPNTRSPKAVATVITTMTEQRRCAAA